MRKKIDSEIDSSEAEKMNLTHFKITKVVKTSEVNLWSNDKTKNHRRTHEKCQRFRVHNSATCDFDEIDKASKVDWRFGVDSLNECSYKCVCVFL